MSIGGFIMPYITGDIPNTIAQSLGTSVTYLPIGGTATSGTGISGGSINGTTGISGAHGFRR